MRKGKKSKLPLPEFRQIKNDLLEVLANSGGRGHFFTRTDFDFYYQDALKKLTDKTATKMQIVRFEQIIKKATADVVFSPYTGD